MPFAKSTKRSRYIAKSKRARGARYSKARAMRTRRLAGRSNDVHSYRRWGTPTTVTMTGAATESDNVDTFMLSAVTGYTELSNLYDQYKIRSVTMKFHLVSNPDRLTTPGTDPAGNYLTPPNYPKLWYVRDYDDGTAVSLATMREMGKAKFKILRPNSICSVTVKPAVLTQLYRTLTTTGYSPSWPKKLDCSQSDIPHYGLKWIIDTDGVSLFTNSQYIVRIEYVYNLTMFNTR